jgi:hypothetical protein
MNPLLLGSSGLHPWSPGLNFEVGKPRISPPTFDFTNWVSKSKMTLNGAWAIHVFSH